MSFASADAVFCSHIIGHVTPVQVHRFAHSVIDQTGTSDIIHQVQ
jgi:hypothetical protein